MSRDPLSPSDESNLYLFKTESAHFLKDAAKKKRKRSKKEEGTSEVDVLPTNPASYSLLRADGDGAYTPVNLASLNNGDSPEIEGFAAWNFDPLYASEATCLPAGTIYLAKFLTQNNYDVRSVYAIIQKSAGGMNHNCFVGLYNSEGTLLACADFSGALTSEGLKDVYLGEIGDLLEKDCSFNVFYIALLTPARTRTAPLFACAPPGNNIAASKYAASSPFPGRFSWYGNSLSTLPDSIDLTATVPSQFAIWLAL